VIHICCSKTSVEILSRVDNAPDVGKDKSRQLAFAGVTVKSSNNLKRKYDILLSVSY